MSKAESSDDEKASSRKIVCTTAHQKKTGRNESIPSVPLNRSLLKATDGSEWILSHAYSPVLHKTGAHDRYGHRSITHLLHWTRPTYRTLVNRSLSLIERRVSPCMHEPASELHENHMAQGASYSKSRCPSADLASSPNSRNDSSGTPRSHCLPTRSTTSRAPGR